MTSAWEVYLKGNESHYPIDTKAMHLGQLTLVGGILMRCKCGLAVTGQDDDTAHFKMADHILSSRTNPMEER